VRRVPHPQVQVSLSIADRVAVRYEQVRLLLAPAVVATSGYDALVAGVHVVGGTEAQVHMLVSTELNTAQTLGADAVIGSVP
jgi:hypothetical protein